MSATASRQPLQASSQQQNRGLVLRSRGHGSSAEQISSALQKEIMTQGPRQLASYLQTQYMDADSPLDKVQQAILTCIGRVIPQTARPQCLALTIPPPNVEECLFNSGRQGSSLQLGGDRVQAAGEKQDTPAAGPASKPAPAGRPPSYLQPGDLPSPTG